MEILEHNLNTGERVARLTKKEFDILNAVDKFLEINSGEDTMLVCQKTMTGYSIEEKRFYKMKYEPTEEG